MKTLRTLLTASMAVAFFATDNCLYGQSTTDNNFGFLGKYLGYSNNAIPLWFRTNNRNRMIIRQGLSGPNAGRIAMGNNLPNNFIPSNRLHA